MKSVEETQDLWFANNIAYHTDNAKKHFREHLEYLVCQEEMEVKVNLEIPVNLEQG